MNRLTRVLIASGVAASLAAVGLVLVGTASAAASTTGASGSSAASPASGVTGFLDDVAARLGIQPAALQKAIGAAETDRVKQMEAAGRIGSAQAQRMLNRIGSGRAAWPAPPFARRGFGRGGMLSGGVLAAAATYLGIPSAQLRADLRAGKSLDAVADATAGKSASGLAAAVDAAIQAQIQSAVGAGRLKASAAEAMQSRLEKMVPALLSRQGGRWHANGQAAGQTAGTTTSQAATT